MKPTLEAITKEGFTLNSHHTTWDGGIPTPMHIYQKGTEFIQYNPKTDEIISRYKVPIKDQRGSGI